ncbi:MAG TPA: ABC transporter permease [bacterium]|nr:ABC transporter permease [bacterium]
MSAVSPVAATGPAQRRRGATASWTLRFGLTGILTVGTLATFAPLIAPYDPTALGLASGLQPPSAAHWFGTDQLGRDILTRVLYAARIDLQIGTIGVIIPLIMGVVIGLFAGYYAGWPDAILGRVIDVVTAFPFLVLVLAIVAMLGPGLRNFYIAISLVSWVAYARIVRGEALSVRGRGYILAARSLGYSDARIVFRHLLPNVIVPALVFGMSDFVLDILAGASLGFFGLGVQPPTPEWGVMIAEGRNFIITAPWVVIFPGVAIVVTSFFVSLIGDSVSDIVRRVHAP